MAFRRLIRLNHPDKVSIEQVSVAKQRTQKLNEAYKAFEPFEQLRMSRRHHTCMSDVAIRCQHCQKKEVLSDPGARHMYDADNIEEEGALGAMEYEPAQEDDGVWLVLRAETRKAVKI